MHELHSFLISAVAFIVLVGLMVIVHEFGHFAVAKLCKVRVEAFSFGFGPRLFGYKYGDTDYKICLLPLGGFVKMTGENPGEGEVADDPGAFTSHPRWQRMLIGVAGPAANFILAFVLMFVYFGCFNEVYSVHPPSLEWVTPGSPADQAGFKPGDAILQFGSSVHPDLGTLLDDMSDSTGQTVPVQVERAGAPLWLSLRMPANSKGEDLSPIGIFPRFVEKSLAVDQVMSGSAASVAGLHPGDTILAVDGNSFHTLDPLLDYLQNGKGKPITLTVRTAAGAQESLIVHPRQMDGGWRLGITAQAYGDIPTRRAPLGLGKASARSLDFCAVGSKMIGQVIQKLITRQASMKQLSGPVGIAVAAGKAAETKDWSSKFGLAAAISLNLGILNLLPFPILDGGMILLLLIESLIRRDISLVVKERIYQAAFVLIVVFFAFIIFNDVSNLSIFSRFRQ
jgi:regulator of sigma E protease